MAHSIRLTATLKGRSTPTLDVSDEIDDATFARLAARLGEAATSPSPL